MIIWCFVNSTANISDVQYYHLNICQVNDLSPLQIEQRARVDKRVFWPQYF